ncbi:reverse transcriptase domain-containing protein [Tanacetum coccineum]
MADNRTMAQMLQAPIEGYEDAIVVPLINANNFELKQTLINLVQSNQFTGRQDPHNHLRFFNKVTSTFRHPDVPNTSIKLLLFPFSLEGEARIWLDKEPPRSILTWDDLVSKFINQFFPPSKTTYLRNEIINFLQKPNETFNEAWERFKGLLRQCPHHGFSELHQLDTFYNSLNTNDQDALDSAAGGNFLDKMPRDGLAIIESKSKVRYSRSRAIEPRVSTNAPLSTSTPSNSFEFQQLAASLEDKMDIRMSRLEKMISEKNVTTPATVKAVEEVSLWLIVTEFVAKLFVIISNDSAFTSYSVLPMMKTSDNFEKFADELAPLDLCYYRDLKKDLTVALDSTNSSILPPPLLDSDSPFTAELSASIPLNSLRNEDKVFKLRTFPSGIILLVFKEPSFLLPPPEPPDDFLNFEPNLVMKNVVLNEDLYQSKKTLPLNVENVNSFTFIIWTFLPYFTYTEESPFSFRRENFVFDPGIVTFHKPVACSMKVFHLLFPKRRTNLQDRVEACDLVEYIKQAASWEFTPCLSFSIFFLFLMCCDVLRLVSTVLRVCCLYLRFLQDEPNNF